MEKNKLRKIKLTTAIIAICIGALMSLSCIGMISMLSDMDSIKPEYKDAAKTIRATSICLLLLAITLIVMGALYCRKKKDKGISIIILVLTSIVTVLQIIGMITLLTNDAQMSPLDVPLMIGMILVVVFSIIYLVQLGKENSVNTTKDGVISGTTQTEVATTATQKTEKAKDTTPKK